MQGLMAASPEELLAVEGIAEITRQHIQGWFALPENHHVSTQLANIWGVSAPSSSKSSTSSAATKARSPQAGGAEATARADNGAQSSRFDAVAQALGGLQRGDSIVVTGSILGITRNMLQDWCATIATVVMMLA
jgi:NAD-dependent DNA ligase